MRSRHLTIVSLLIKDLNASVPQLPDLNGRMERLSLGNNMPKGMAISNAPKSSQSFLDILDYTGEDLNGIVSEDYIRRAVQNLDIQLAKLVASGVPPLDTTPIIGNFLLDSKKLVIIAQEIRAYTLLRLLQMIYIWRDEAQFYWFQALSYLSPWYDRKMWETYSMDWGGNIWAVCELDNVALLLKIRQKVPNGHELEGFNNVLLLQCANYDAIKIFKAARLDPIQLEGYLALMSAKGSVNLLYLYKVHTKIGHLHLERFLFPETSPVSVEAFAFLLSNGYDYFPMDRFIEKFCKEGRLDLLMYLRKLETQLIPSDRDLWFAAEKGHLDVLKWANQLELIDARNLDRLTTVLTAKRHFQALEWLHDEKKLIGWYVVREAINFGALDILQWVFEKNMIKGGQREWADWAASNCHFPILKWLYTRLNFLPSYKHMRNATVEMLEWLNGVREGYLSHEYLVKFGVKNLVLLQWVHANAKSSVFTENREPLSRGVCNKELMIWLYKNLGICPYSMDWAYRVGDLGAIKWARNNCKIFPMTGDVCLAAKNGHLKIIKWIHRKNYSKRLRMDDVLKRAIEFGSLRIANYVMLNFVLERRFQVEIYGEIRTDRRLKILKWAHRHKFSVIFLEESCMAARRGELQTLKWLVKVFSNTQPGPFAWELSARRGHHEVYKWLLVNFPMKRQLDKLYDDLRAAFYNGNLEVVKVIIHHYPRLTEELLKLRTTRASYHIHRWFLEPVNGDELIGLLGSVEDLKLNDKRI